MNTRKGKAIGTLIGMFFGIHVLQVYSEWDFPQPVVGDTAKPAYFDNTASVVSTTKQ